MARKDADTKRTIRYVNKTGHNYMSVSRHGRFVRFRNGLGNPVCHTSSQARYIAKKLIQFAEDIERDKD